MKDEERILCAAIHYEDGKHYPGQPENITTGIVLCGRRHHNIIANYYILTGKMEYMSTQGFITSHDRFVNRVDAMEIATAAKQVGQTQKAGELFSEDLY